MWTDAKNGNNAPTDYKYRSATVDLTAGSITIEEKPCADLEDFLGGIGRIFKVLGHHDVSDPYDPAAPLVMELGCFSGTNVMTGLRTFFGGSPEGAMAALLDLEGERLDEEALERLSEMIEEATNKAREVAQKFASDSASRLGKIKRARQGQFSITRLP